MAIRIKSRSGESVEQMLRRFKKLCEKEGLTKDVKRRQYYEKPSERNRRAERKAALRITKSFEPPMLGPGGKPMTGGRMAGGRPGPGGRPMQGGRSGPGGRPGPGGRSGGGRPGPR